MKMLLLHVYFKTSLVDHLN